MAIKHFHFSLGPVQSFIAQARRTRDFWAGSFLLSWLSAVAMQAVKKQSGKIVFPEADDDYLLLWLKKNIEGKNPPEQGGIPNRFKAEVNDHFKPELVVDSVNKAWQALAEKVYEGDLKAIDNENTKIIWKRQVKAFWDMSWVITDDLDNSSALDVRKNWRSYLPPEEAGVKCMMMAGWQELSGADRPNAGGLATFWQAVRKNSKIGIKTDLREKEHLCAIAFIKRRFPRYFNDVAADMPNNWTLHGWEVKAGRPSVAYMAAVHWLEEVLKIAQDHEHYPEVADQLWRFHDAAIDLTDGNYNEWDNQIECIKKYTTSNKWKALDGSVFFETALENANIYAKQAQAQKVLTELKELQRLVQSALASQAKPDLRPASPFYAVLMMDGDSLGKQMSDGNKQKTIAQGLKIFTDTVPNLVQQHNGFLIYAGGDDVLAVLPLEDALPCSLAIREEYTRIFKALNDAQPEKPPVFTSISAAIEFAHIKMPLMKILKDAHDLLDKVAKEKCGRDSLAVRVWKPGGMVLQWTMPWEKAIEDGNEGKKRLVLERLADDFANDDDAYGQLSNKFLYKIRERFDLLNPPDKNAKSSEDKEKPKEEEFALSQEQAVELMAAEYFSSGLCEPYPAVDRMQHARHMVKPLLEQCRPVYRNADEPNPDNWTKDKKVLPDAALLVRFLAQKGVNL